MKPEQVTNFKCELATLGGTWAEEDLLAWVNSLFVRYDLPLESNLSERERRHCTTPPVPIYTSVGVRSSLQPSGYKTYTGNTAYLLSGGSVELGWCPTQNVLLLRSESWTEEDTYLRIPGSHSVYIDVVWASQFVGILYDYSPRWALVWTPEERAELESAAGQPEA